MKTILVIDDEKEICRSLKGILSDEGYHVKTAQTPEDALSQLEDNPPHLILLDVWFGKGSWDGIYLLDRLKHTYPLMPIIMISGHGTLELAVRALKKGAYDFIEKPIEVERLLFSVTRALETAQLRSFSIKRIHKTWPIPLAPQLKKAANSESRILLIGEHGMEKKRLAHDLHLRSSRKSGPFIVTTGQALNEMAEEELWGLESHGQVEKLGFFEYAQGGTLVLHHIHSLSLPLQQQLAKIFESGSCCRLGATKPVPLNIRFIATALPAFMEESLKIRFRKEFYDRITLFPFFLRPLRDKRNEITLWIQTLIPELCHDLGIPTPNIGEDALRILQTYTWPGNIRELRNVLERALMFCKGQTLSSADFPTEVAHVFSSLPDNVFSLPLHKARALFEYNYLCAQLAAVKGNISRAAHVIGMERSALHRKLKALENRTKDLTSPLASSEQTYDR